MTSHCLIDQDGKTGVVKNWTKMKPHADSIAKALRTRWMFARFVISIGFKCCHHNQHA